MAQINDNTSITIPLRNLIALIAGTAVAVTGYFHIVERLTMLEHNQEMVTRDVEANSTWIVDWEKEGLLPADIIQNNKLEFLESRVLKMENILENGKPK
jgi:hypothetical protein|tara:strand:- start:2189 stop:2485 length:297 start_codon:yes stop_codon:yes gene_type:complete